MHFWLLIEGEPLPTDNDESRLHRMCSLAETLHDRGHKITLWSSTMNHRDKTLRTSNKLISNYKPGYDIILIDSPPYKKNISPARIIHNLKTAEEFTKIASREDILKPDIIVAAYPPIELAFEGVKYALKNNIPSVVDVRDLWPDIFIEVLPSWLQFYGKLALRPFAKKASFIADNATSIVSISDEFADWFEKKSKKEFLKDKKSFHLSYKVEQMSEADKSDARKFWEEIGVSKLDNFFTICFFGNLTENAEIPLLIDAAKKINYDQKHNVRFIICGVGSILKNLIDLSANVPTIFLPGWVTKKQIRYLMQISDAGILPYRSDRGFELSYPNKVGEYLSEGLPIISSIRGVLSSLLDKEKIGITYKNQNVDDLVKAIYSLIEDKNLEKEMRLNAKKVFDKRFDANKVYNDYINFLEKQIYSHIDNKDR